MSNLMDVIHKSKEKTGDGMNIILELCVNEYQSKYTKYAYYQGLPTGSNKH